MANNHRVQEMEQPVIDVNPASFANDNVLVRPDLKKRSLIFNKFAHKVLCDLPRCDKNDVICTVNLFASMTMLYMGSNGDSFFDLQRFLRSKSFSDDIVFETIRTILEVFANERFKLRPNYHLINVIRLLIDKKAQSSDTYKTSIKRFFNVDIDKIDFERDFDLIGEQIIELIRTELNLEDIHDFQTFFDESTQLVILNALYFKGKWEIQFPLEEIKNEYFFNDGNKETRVQMMAILHRNFNYAFVIEWDSHVVEIPMAAQSMVFIMILPQMMDGLDRMLDEFNYNILKNALNSVRGTRCDIFLPKFKLECDYDFANLYSKLKVFKNDKELKEIGGNHRIKANNILHKVVFEIDDNGVYAVTPDLTRLGIPRKIRANHPFVFLIRDNRTETLVFVGKVHRL